MHDWISVADPWQFGTDPDPDPAIFVSDVKDGNKKLFWVFKFFYYRYYFNKGKFTSFFKGKKS